MEIVAGGNQDGIDFGIAQHFGKLGGRVVRPKLFRQIRRAVAGAAHHRLQMKMLGEIAQVRQVHRLGEIARANQREAHQPLARGPRLHIANRPHFRPRHRRRRIGEQHQRRFHRALAHGGVGLGRLRHGKHRADQRLEIDPAFRHEPQVFAHVAVLGPAHVGQRIIESALLVVRVVATGAVRARDEEVEFLGVKIGAVQIQPDIADQHDAAFFPAHLERRRDDRIRRRGRRDDDAVGPRAVRQPRDLLGVAAVVGVDADVLAEFLRDANASAIQVGADDATTIGAEQLGGELAENAEADHDEGFAQRRLRASHALHRNRAERHRRGFGETEFVGQQHGQIARHADDLGMMRALRPGARDAITHGEVRDAVADFEDGSRRRVARRLGFVEFAFDQGFRGAESLGGNHLQRLLHLLGLLERALPQRQAAGLDAAHFRADGNARVIHPHQHCAWLRDGRRDVIHQDLAFLDEHLLQDQIPRVSMTIFSLSNLRSTRLNSR